MNDDWYRRVLLLLIQCRLAIVYTRKVEEAWRRP